MSHYKRAMRQMADRIQSADELRDFMNMYGVTDDSYMQERLFSLCMNEIHSEEGELSPTFLLANSPSLDTSGNMQMMDHQTDEDVADEELVEMEKSIRYIYINIIIVI